MAETMDPELALTLREESERTRSDPYPPGAVPERPGLRTEYAVRVTRSQQQHLRDAATDQGMTEHELIQSWVAERLAALTEAPAATASGHVKG